MSTGGLTLRQFKILLSVFYLKVVLVHRANVTKWLGTRWAQFSKKHEEITLAQSDQKWSLHCFGTFPFHSNLTQPNTWVIFCSGNQAKHGIQIIYLALLLAATWGWTCLWRMGLRSSWMCSRCHIWSHFAANAQNDVYGCRGGALAKWFEAPVLRDNKQTKQNIPGLRTPSGLVNLKKLMVA